MQVGAVGASLNAQGRQLAVLLSKKQMAELELLKTLFGCDFGINQLIYLAFNLIEKGIVKQPLVHSDAPDGEKVEFQPNEESLRALLKLGKADSASLLSAIGIGHLYEKLEISKIIAAGRSLIVDV
jgi:hypothetical protein